MVARARPLETSESKSTDSRIVAANSAIDALRHLSVLALNGVMIFFLPRYLGAEGLGQLQFALSFVTLFSIGVTLGIKGFLIKEIARDHATIERYIGSAVVLRLVMSLIVAGLIFGAAQIVGISLEGRVVVYIAIVWMVAQSFAELSSAILYGLEDLAWPAIGEVIGKIVVIAAGIAVLVTGHGVIAYAIVVAVGTLVRFAVTTGYVARRFPIRPSFDLPNVRLLISGGLPFIFMGFLLTAYAHVDIVTLQLLTNATVVGWYTAARQIFMTVEFIPVALTSALLPTLSRLRTTDMAILIGIAQKGIYFGLLLIMPIAVGGSLVAKDLIRVLPYPDEFNNSVPLLRILALSTPVTGLLTILGAIVIAVDRQKFWAMALAATLLLNLVLNIVFITVTQNAYGNGGIGAALTTVVSELFMVAIGIWLVPKAILDREMYVPLLKIGMATAVMAAVTVGCSRAGIPFIPKVALSAVTYCTLIVAVRGVTRRDLTFVIESLRQRRRSSPGQQSAVRAK